MDVTNETLIAIRDVPRYLPTRSNGKRLHISAVYRWIQRGVRGVILESVRIGGSTYTSREGLQRFAECLSLMRPQPPPPSAPPSVRQRQIDRVEKAVLEELGLNTPVGRDARAVTPSASHPAAAPGSPSERPE